MVQDPLPRRRGRRQHRRRPTLRTREKSSFQNRGEYFHFLLFFHDRSKHRWSRLSWTRQADTGPFLSHQLTNMAASSRRPLPATPNTRAAGDNGDGAGMPLEGGVNGGHRQHFEGEQSGLDACYNGMLLADWSLLSIPSIAHH